MTPFSLLTYQRLVAGYFDCIGGIEASNVASWDGKSWCSIGNSVFNRAIHAVAVWRDTVYVGGSFFELDGQPLRFLARFIGDHSTDNCSEPISAAPEPGSKDFNLWPNPASDQLQIQAPAPIETVWVFDARGHFVLQQSGSGEQRMSVSLRELGAGLYFINMQADGNMWSGKFVKSGD